MTRMSRDIGNTFSVAGVGVGGRLGGGRRVGICGWVDGQVADGLAGDDHGGVGVIDDDCGVVSGVFDADAG